MSIRSLFSGIFHKRPSISKEELLRSSLMERVEKHMMSTYPHKRRDPYRMADLQVNIDKCSAEIEGYSLATLEAIDSADQNPDFVIVEQICRRTVPKEHVVRSISLFYDLLSASKISYTGYPDLIAHIIDRLLYVEAIDSAMLTEEREENIVRAILTFMVEMEIDHQLSMNRSVVEVLGENPELATKLCAYIRKNGIEVENVDAHRFAVEQSAPVAALAEGML